MTFIYRLFPQSVLFLLGLALVACSSGTSTNTTTDAGGNGNDDTGGSNVDTTAPTARIVFPPAVSKTDSNSITVRGTASDDSEITVVRVNGVDATSSDGFATWEATVNLTPGRNTLTVETGDIALNSNAAAATTQIDSVSLMATASDMVLDSANNRLLVADPLALAIFAVDMTTGLISTVSSNTTPAGGPLFASPQRLALDSSNNRLLVVDIGIISGGSQGAVLAVDLDTGARSIFSDNATPDANTPFSAPEGIALDSANGRALVLDYLLNAVVAVDLATGARSILSDDTTPDANNALLSPKGIVVDSANNRALITNTDYNTDLSSVIAVDLNTGVRTILSDDTTPDSNNPFSGYIERITLDSANNRALVTDSDLDAVIAVDLTTGARTLLSDNNTPNSARPFSWPRSILLDSANDRALVADEDVDQIIAVDLSSGARSFFTGSATPESANAFGSIRALETDSANNRALVADYDYVSQNGRLMAVNLDTGARSVISDATTPDSNNTFGNLSDIALDAANNRVLAARFYAVYSVDLNTGARTVLSRNGIPDANNGFQSIRGIALDSNNGRALVVDTRKNAVIAMDLSTGARTILSDGATPDNANAFSYPTSIALDSANNCALVTDDNLNAVIAVDLDTGARTIFSDNATPDANNPFDSPRSITLDRANNRALVTDLSYSAGDAIIAVDLTTGARSIVANDTTPDNNNTILSPFATAIDERNNRILVIDSARDALFSIDPVSGQRVLFSR